MRLEGAGVYAGTDRDMDLIRARLSLKLDSSTSGSLGSKELAPATWNGTYFGLHAGYGWGREDHVDSFFLDGGVPAPVGYHNDVRGALAGGHLGLNRQLGSWVLGGEISLSGGNIDGSLTDCVVRGGGTQHTDCTSKVEGLLTAMGRVGWASNSWLAYGTAGWAVASLNFETRRTDAGGAGIPQFASDNGFASGFAYCAGIELVLTPALRLASSSCTPTSTFYTHQ